MQIVHISDTHQHFPKNLPEGDVLVHTGDYSLLSKLANEKKQIEELKELNRYFGTLNYDKIYFTPGNHDWIFEKNLPLAEQILSNATVLLDSSDTYKGLKFYGTPSQPPFANWAFNHDTSLRTQKYRNIPEDTDILLTHCPPKNILDLVSDYAYSSGQNVGCPILAHEVENRIKPKLHCCGHIHENNDVVEIYNITYSNAAIMDDFYKPTGKPNVIKLEIK